MTLNYHPLDLSKMLEIAQHIEPDNNFTILEFGVATGNTMCAMLDALIQHNKNPKYVYGFDSFEGLPEEDPSASINPEWFPGAFNIVSELKNKDIDTNTTKGIELVKNRFEKYPFEIKIVVGWYSDLTIGLAEAIKPAKYIHIDCDMYISAYQALRWLAQNNLIANGCIIRYDDWLLNPNIGENKAHNQICIEYKYVANKITSMYSNNTFFRFTK